MARHRRNLAQISGGMVFFNNLNGVYFNFPMRRSWFNDEGAICWEENPEFVTWIGTVKSFAFDDKLGGHFTARKEQRRAPVWYAFAYIGGKTIKRYIGTDAALTSGRLHELATEFRTLRRGW